MEISTEQLFNWDCTGDREIIDVPGVVQGNLYNYDIQRVYFVSCTCDLAFISHIIDTQYLYMIIDVNFNSEDFEF